MNIESQQMNIVIVGHVDHGKSTVIGRMLADTDSLPEGKLQSIKEKCERESKPFEYAFLLDALKDEQSQGITIDSARVFFQSKKRNYIIIDAPGHIEFLKNMITGASRADAALLVIDAAEGVQENSRRHGYMLSMLGISQVVVLINKMDLVDYSEKVYQSIQLEYTEFLNKIGLSVSYFVPVSGRNGDNIVGLSEKMPWYKGVFILNALDQFTSEKDPGNQPFRMPVQDVYKFTRFGDARRIIAGTISTGSLSVGDDIIFLPSGKKSKVKSIEVINPDSENNPGPGQAIGFTLVEQIYVTRGELAVKLNEKSPCVGTRFKVSLFWLSREEMIEKKDYTMKIGTTKVPVQLETVERIIDASNLDTLKKKKVGRHDVAEVVLKTKQPVAYDLAQDLAQTSRFVIVDNYEISGGGIIREDFPKEKSEVQEHILMRNYKWEKGSVTMARRSERYSQRPTLIVITGDSESDKKNLSKSLEEKLFQEGRFVYYLGIGNVKYGVDADLSQKKKTDPKEHVRRMAEVAHIILDMGAILIVTATDLTQEHLELIKASVNQEVLISVWVGNEITTDIKVDLHLDAEELAHTDCAARLKEHLQQRGTIFRLWE